MINRIAKKRETGRSGGSEPGRPRFVSLPGPGLAEAVSRHPIQIGRRSVIFLAGMHVRERREGTG
jgi:hypothetical protein